MFDLSLTRKCPVRNRVGDTFWHEYRPVIDA